MECFLVLFGLVFPWVGGCFGVFACCEEGFFFFFVNNNPPGNSIKWIVAF